MAGTVAEFNEYLGSYSNDQGKNIAQLWVGWDSQRTQKKADWSELSAYLFATDTTTTSAGTLPWKNSTTMPKLTQLRDNLHSNYISAMFPNDRWLDWKATSLEDNVQAKKQAILGYMRNKLREGGFETTISRLVLDYIDYGNAFAIVDFVSEGWEDENTKEWNSTYMGPKVRRISPYDIVFNPVADTFGRSPAIVRNLYNIGELQELSTQSGQGFWEDVLRDRDELRRLSGSLQTSDMQKVNQYQIDGFGSIYEYYQSEFIEVLTFYGDWYDPSNGKVHKNREITVIDRCRVVNDVQSQTWVGRDSLCATVWRKRPDNLYGMGPLDNLVGMQYRIDHLENLKADAMDLVVHPPLKIIGDVEPFQWGPNTQINIVEGDVQEMGNNLNGMIQANNEIAMLEQRMEDYAGAPKQAMGIRTPGEKTAFEVQQLEAASGRIFQEKVDNFEKEILEPILNAMLAFSLENLDIQDTVEVMDSELGVTLLQEVTKEDIVSSGKLYPIGSRHFGQQAQLLQNLNQLMAGPMGQMIAPHVSTVELAKVVSDALQLDGYNIVRPNAAVAEQAQSQGLAQEGQAANMENLMIPPAE